MKKAYVIGTCDTKIAELVYLRDLIRQAGVPTVLVDLGLRSDCCIADVRADEVATYHPAGADAVHRSGDRGLAVSDMALAFAHFVVSRSDIGGMLGLGGGGGTALIAPGLQALPIGVPKIMLSTLASGDVSAFVGESDISMVHSVTDVAGLNRISRPVFANAAHALVGMLQHAAPPVSSSELPAIGMTMCAVTKPCVEAVRSELEADHDCLVFQATGTGGRTLEKLVDSGLITGVIDATTTEICDHMMGGISSAGEERLDAIARTRVPYVGSCGALDIVNFGALGTVPRCYQDREFYVDNARDTWMRTTAEECERIGAWIAGKLNRCLGPVRFLIPEKGVSAIDRIDEPFYDPEANAALFGALEHYFDQTEQRRLLRTPFHINDVGFSLELVRNLREVVELARAQ